MKVRDMLKKIYFSLRALILYLLPSKSADSSIPAQDIRSILVIRIDRIGDLVVSLPALKALKENFPQAKISVLVRCGNEALLKNFSWIGEVIIYRGFGRAVKQLRQKHFDLVVDFLMDYPLETALLAYLSQARLTAGFNIESRGRLFAIGINPDPEKKHVSLYILDLVGEIARAISGKAVRLTPAYPEIILPQQDKQETMSFLKNHGIGESGPLVGIHPGGHYPSQRWPVERFSQLADRIIKRHKARVVVVGSAADEALVETMAGLMSGKAIKAVGLRLDKLAALISLMNIFICNNSGPLHIACLVKTATVSTMGPTDPVLWKPPGDGHTVLRHGSSLESISVEEMERAVDARLSGITAE